MWKRDRLINQNFKDIVNESGANVMELSLAENLSLRTWGNSEKGDISGMYFYNSSKNEYGQVLPFL